MAMDPSLVAGKVAKDPPNPPMGVLTADTTNTRSAISSCTKVGHPVKI